MKSLSHISALISIFTFVFYALFIGYSSVCAEPPTVISTSPGNGETGVANDLSEITITFSKQMNDASSVGSTGWPFAQGGQYWSADRKTFHLPRDPNTQLQKATLLTLILNPDGYIGFRDLEGNALEKYTFNFTTEGDGTLNVYIRASQEDMNKRKFRVEFREQVTEGAIREFEFPGYGGAGTPRSDFITPFLESPDGICAFDNSGNKVTYEFRKGGSAVYGYTVYPTAGLLGSGYCNQDIGVFDIWGSFPQLSVVTRSSYDEVNLTFDVPTGMQVYSPWTKESGRVVKLVENGVHPQAFYCACAWGNFSDVEKVDYGNHTFYRLGYNTDCTNNFTLAKSSYDYFMTAVSNNLDSLFPASLYVVVPSDEGYWHPSSEGLGGSYMHNEVGNNWNPIFRNTPSECGGDYFRWAQNGSALTIAPVHHITHATINGFINDWWPVEGIAVYYQIVMLNKVGILTLNETKREFIAHLECYQNEIIGSENDYALKDFGFGDSTYSNYVLKMIAYIKGALAFYALNEIIKETTRGQYELIDLFANLYGMFEEGYNKNYSTFIMALNSLTGRDFQEFFEKFIYSNDPLPLEISGDDIVLTYMPERPSFYVNNNDKTCGGKTPCHSTIRAAIDAANTGTAIKIAQGTYPEAITLSTSKFLILQGGWDSSFTSQTSNKTFIKAPMATQGSLTLQMVTIKP